MNDAVVVRLPWVAWLVGGGLILLGGFVVGLDGLVAIGGRGVMSVGGLGVALAGAGVLFAAATFSARVSDRGVLRVRSWPPWSLRVVDLAALVEVSGRPGPALANPAQPSVATTVLHVRDASGRTVRVNALLWGRGDRLLAAVRTGVARSGARVDERAAGHLADARVGRGT